MVEGVLGERHAAARAQLAGEAALLVLDRPPDDVPTCSSVSGSRRQTRRRDRRAELTSK